MRKIEIAPDCGNAPRKIFLADLFTALAKGNASFIAENIPENILWKIVGGKLFSGRDRYVAELKNSPLWKVKRLKIDTIITHGKDASVSGEIIAKDDSRFSFCEVYKFKGAARDIVSVTTFIIKR